MQMPRLISANGVQVGEDILFTNVKGETGDRSRKRAEEALASLHDILPNLLGPNEAVLYIIKTCQAPLGTLEQLFLGWYVYRVTATRLVFTNLRLRHFGLGAGGKWNRTLKSVRWGDVTKAKVKGWINRLLELRYADGKNRDTGDCRRKTARRHKQFSTPFCRRAGRGNRSSGIPIHLPELSRSTYGWKLSVRVMRAEVQRGEDAALADDSDPRRRISLFRHDAPGRARVFERGGFYTGYHYLRTDGTWVDGGGKSGKQTNNSGARAMGHSTDIGDYPRAEQSIGIYPRTARGPFLHSVEPILIKVVRLRRYKSFSAEFNLPYSLV